MTSEQKPDFLKNFLIYLLFFLAVWYITGLFIKPKEEAASPGSAIEISTKDEWITGQLITVDVKNNTKEPLTIGENQNPPENIVFEREDPASKDFVPIAVERTSGEKIVLAPGEKKTLSFSANNNEIFPTVGAYKICLSQDEERFCAKFALESPGILRSVWRALFFKPIFNVLIFFTDVFPGHNLALAILALTILIKVILIGPSKKALVQQQKMQKVQIEIEAMRKKYAGDQQKIAEETMALWKKHGVNPFASFLPMLIQMPIMIALFYVVKDGLMPHNSIYLWPPLKEFSLTLISKDLFGVLNLEQAGVLWLAIVVGLLQFVSIKLTMAMRKPAKDQEKDDKKAQVPDQMQAMNKMMIYGMPALITFFAFSMPAAVGFYWGISTIFSIGQQWLLREHK